MNLTWIYRNLTSYENKREALKKFIPIYGVFKEVDGVLYGYTEHSFSMQWSPNEVRIWSYTSADSILKRILKENKKAKVKSDNVFIYRISRRNGKIKVDFNDRKNTLKENYQKYYFRNAKFLCEGNVAKQLAAAE